MTSTHEILQICIYNINIINDMKNDNKDINNYISPSRFISNTFLNFCDFKTATNIHII